MAEKCKLCNKKISSIEGMYSHLDSEHNEFIPKNFTPSQYYYLLKTNKDHSNCIVCKKPTRWNESTKKYYRFCDNVKCKDKYREEFKKRMINKHGKIHLLNDPSQQIKMLANRKISGIYEWSDGGKISYTGTYELDFLKFLDTVMEFNSDDIMSPSPHVYNYTYENTNKFYIPDIFIPSLNLEIEIKESNNMHHKILAVDKVKEELKDEVLLSQKSFSYIKIIDKDYKPFFDLLLINKERIIKYPNNNRPIFIVPKPQGIKDIKTLYTQDSNTVVKEFITPYYIDDDIKLHFEEWDTKPGMNILYITGYSGSGKTTLLKDIVKTFKCKYIELDDIGMYLYLNKKDISDVTNNQISIKTFNNYSKTNDTIKSITNFNSDNMSKYFKLCSKAIDEYLKYTIDTLSKDTNTLYVIEGYYLANTLDPHELIGKPLIIKNTPLLKSLYNRTRRDNPEYNIIKALYVEIHDNDILAHYKEAYKYINNMKSVVLNEGIHNIDTKKYFDKNSLENLEVLIKIRGVQKNDITQIQNILDNITEEEKKYLALNLKISLIKQMIKQEKHCYVALIDDKIVGFMRESGRPNNFSLLEELVVHPNYRKQGIGFEMLRYYHSTYSKSMAKTNTANTKMIALLKKFNYYPLDTEAKRIIIWERVEVNDMKSVVLNEGIHNIDTIFNAKYRTKKNKYPVYIVLSLQGTPLSRIVSFVTRSKASHSSISFDLSMERMYTFGILDMSEGTNARYLTNESFKNAIMSNSVYSLYALFLTKEQIMKIHTKLDSYEGKVFSFSGLIRIFFNKTSDYENKKFCSEFVAELLKEAVPELLKKHPSLYSPKDFINLDDVYYIDGGRVAEYNQELAERNVRDIINFIDSK